MAGEMLNSTPPLSGNYCDEKLHFQMKQTCLLGNTGVCIFQSDFWMDFGIWLLWVTQVNEPHLAIPPHGGMQPSWFFLVAIDIIDIYSILWD